MAGRRRSERPRPRPSAFEVVGPLLLGAASGAMIYRLDDVSWSLAASLGLVIAVVTYLLE